MRTIPGEYGTNLQIPMLVAAAWQATVAVGDLCALGAVNWTVQDSLNDGIPLGKIVALNEDSTIATVEIYGYTCVRAFTTTGAVALGTSINVDGAGTNVVETKAADETTLCISDPGGVGTAYVLIK